MKKCGHFELEDLNLSPATTSSLSEIAYRKADTVDEESKMSEEQITIFYDGNVYVFDMIELQVRALMVFATREEMKTTAAVLSPPELHSQILGPPGGYIKKSLHTFLQNRRRVGQLRNFAVQRP